MEKDKCEKCGSRNTERKKSRKGKSFTITLKCSDCGNEDIKLGIDSVKMKSGVEKYNEWM